MTQDQIVLLGLAVFALGNGLCAEWDLRIAPLFIPAREIEETVDKLIAKFGEAAEQEVLIEEQRAWLRSEPDEEGRWRRIRRALRQRGEAGGRRPHLP